MLEIIALIMENDEWLPEKLENQWEALKNDPYCMWVTCTYREDAENNIDSLQSNMEMGSAQESFKLGTLLLRKHALIDLKGFNVNNEKGSIKDLICRLNSGNYPQIHLKKILLNTLGTK